MREGASGRGARVVGTPTRRPLNVYGFNSKVSPLLPFHYRRPQPLLGFTPRHDHHPQAGEARGKVRGTVKLYPVKPYGFTALPDAEKKGTLHGLQGPEWRAATVLSLDTAPASAHMDTLIDPEINPTNTDDGAQRYASHLRPPCPTRCPPHPHVASTRTMST